jgi:hypothetical protein
MNQTQIIGALMLATGKRVEDVAKENGYSKFAFIEPSMERQRHKGPAR